MPIVSIRLKPYLKKFIISISQNKAEPVRFKKGSDWNMLLKDLVTNYNQLRLLPIMDKERVILHFSSGYSSNEIINIKLPRFRRKNVDYHNYISFDSEKEFVADITNYYKYCFRRHLRQSLSMGIQRKTAIESFMKLHNISEDDVKYSSLYRYSTRLIKTDKLTN